MRQRRDRAYLCKAEAQTQDGIDNFAILVEAGREPERVRKIKAKSADCEGVTFFNPGNSRGRELEIQMDGNGVLPGVTHGLRPDSRGGFAANIRTAIETGRFNRPCRDFDYGQIEVDSRIVGG